MMPSYDPVSQTRKKKKVTIIGLASLILVAMVVAVAVSVSRGSSGNGTPKVSASVKAIESICQPTDYKESCVSTLTQASGGNISDPRELVQLAFKVAMDNIHEAFNRSKVLQDAQKDPRAAHALENCQELLDYSVDDLRRSVSQIETIDVTAVHKIIADLKVWLSAALTYEETCLDGFENTDAEVKESMEKAMNKSMELTSNVLAIVNELSAIFTDLNLPFFKRRLLSDEQEEENLGVQIPEDGDGGDGLPSWVSEGKRRLLQAPMENIKPNLVVAKDGSGDFKTIGEALGKMPKKSKTPFVIYIKEGLYVERLRVNRSHTNLVMIGDGPTKTRISGSLNYVDGVGTYRTATVAIKGDGFIGKDIGIENTAGPHKHQAVALRVQSDMSVFYNCRFDGYQDTLYCHTYRQFYRDCTITGTIDFIFGNSAAFFQNCLMLVRRPMDNQRNIVTAQGRKDRREPTAIILHNCTIAADPDLYPVRAKLRTYLGRPWKEYSRTFIMQSQLDDLIDPQGWLPWSGDFALRTCFYTEFDNRGPGAGLSQRAQWKGIKRISYEHAQQFTVERFLQGESWLGYTGVPYFPGLLPVTNLVPRGGMAIPGVITDPSERVPGVITDPSERVPGVITDPSERIPGVVTDPSERVPGAIIHPLERVPGVVTDPSKRVPGVVTNPSEHVPDVVTDPSERIPGVVTDPSEHVPDVVTDPPAPSSAPSVATNPVLDRHLEILSASPTSHP